MQTEKVDYAAFGKYVKRLREVRGLTQEELAERTDLAADTVRRLERQEFSPSLRTLRKLCRGLGISVGVLFTGFELPEADPTYEALTMLLQGQEHRVQKLILRLAQSLVQHIEQSRVEARQPDAAA